VACRRGGHYGAKGIVNDQEEYNSMFAAYSSAFARAEKAESRVRELEEALRQIAEYPQGNALKPGLVSSRVMEIARDALREDTL
jgi:formiminotetrahydrofolate cyclodeaminase